ncbi:hypothetical protein [Paraburkholderia aromaticivorans]|uniref:hypothetical protein n=1 Tax=Paraburkholderia aromaticivorans TaxID=2026199 RepID=UPI0014561490|nr:hypothetical protein [Paraburkholderia aromaticivorans]
MNRHAHVHRQVKPGKHGWVTKNPLIVPIASQDALRKAMEFEGISPTEFSDLLWIMAQESAGVVNAHDPASTARGLFELLHVQYGLNPNGEKFFGNAVEECQGGIRYIMGRYHSAANARKF